MNTNYLKDFVPCEQALALKEVGFDEPCLMSYLGKDKEPYLKCDDILHLPAEDVLNPLKAPTFSQAFRWFREEYGLQCWPEITGTNTYLCRYDGNDETGKRWVGYLKAYGETMFYSKYEEAELACLKKLIEIVKTTQK